MPRRRLLLLAAGPLSLAACVVPPPAEPAADTPAVTSSRPPAVTSSSPPAPCSPDAPVEAASWGTAEGGRSLQVSPTDELRGCGGALARWEDPPPGWAAVVALAGPEADSPAMEQQYACHLRFAREKSTWNLEPWRPEVDDETLLHTLCNP